MHLSPKKPGILFLDRDPAFFYLFRLIAQEKLPDLPVEHSTNGKEFLTKLEHLSKQERKLPYLIILGDHMGIFWLERIKSKAVYCCIPIILLSESEEKNISFDLEVGQGLTHLAKPMNYLGMVELVDQILSFLPFDLHVS